MVTVTKKESEKTIGKESFVLAELSGLSTDTKPTEIGSTKIDNGSTYIEIDTGSIYLYDLENQEWQEI